MRQKRALSSQTNAEYLRKKFEEAKAKSEQAQKTMIEFAKIHSLPIGGNAFQDVNAEKYSVLVTNLGAVVEERAQSAGELRQLRKASQSSTGAASPDSLEILTKIAELKSLKSRYNNSQLGRLIKRDIDRQVQGLRDVMSVTNRHAVEQGKIRKRAAEERERLLRNEIEKLQGEERELYDTKVQYALLINEAEQAKANVATLKERLDLAIVEAESDRKTVTIVDPALPPASSLPQQKASTILSGALAGFLFGVALVMIIDLQDSSIRTIDDLHEISQAPLLGTVPKISTISPSKLEKSEQLFQLLPHYNDERSQFSDIIHTKIIEDDNIEFGVPVNADNSKTPIVIRSPLSRESESFRNIRTTLQLSAESEDPRVILMTSGQKGDGKTTVATNLAACLAQSNYRTILIDADLRMPKVHTYFGLKRSATGLSDYLASARGGNGEPYKVNDHLWVLPAGGLSASPAELLCTPRLTDLIENLRGEYDYVIVDAPPVGDMSDALLLSRIVDGVVLVVRSGYTSKAVAHAACARLAQIRATIIGVTFNGTDYENHHTENQSGVSLLSI